jgi:hypothetical protein
VGLSGEVKNKGFTVAFEGAECLLYRVFVPEVAAVNSYFIALVADVVEFTAGGGTDEDADISIVVN